jgi:hypothetical protein
MLTCAWPAVLLRVQVISNIWVGAFALTSIIFAVFGES